MAVFTESRDLAPCVAIVGPPNSGKTTLLHLLDHALRKHPSKPLAYVVKGNPDGTGRYLLYAKDQRDLVKSRVKGKWDGTATIEQIRQWTRNSRRWLEIALLDFGGMHSVENIQMLAECSHYIIVCRTHWDIPAQEPTEGVESWRVECQKAGLQEIAVIDSHWKEGEASAPVGVPMRGSFRADYEEAVGNANEPLVYTLVAAMLALPQPGRIPPYVNLARQQRWDVATPWVDFHNFAGPEIGKLALSNSSVRLGGGTALFAYLMAVSHALAINRETGIELFDPKLPQGFVEIPARLTGAKNPDFPYDDIAVSWIPEAGPGDHAVLDILLRDKDRFLAPQAAEHLADLPIPMAASQVVGRQVKLFGGLPTWVWAAYLRCLIEWGASSVKLWDMGSKSYILIYPSVSV